MVFILFCLSCFRFDCRPNGSRESSTSKREVRREHSLSTNRWSFVGCCHFLVEEIAAPREEGQESKEKEKEDTKSEELVDVR